MFRSSWKNCGAIWRARSAGRMRCGGWAEDALRLALHPERVDPGELDLSAVTEFKVTDKGVEVKLVDRVKALATLCELLECSGSGGAEELYRALEDAAGQMRGGWDDA